MNMETSPSNDKGELAIQVTMIIYVPNEVEDEEWEKELKTALKKYKPDITDVQAL